MRNNLKDAPERNGVYQPGNRAAEEPHTFASNIEQETNGDEGKNADLEGLCRPGLRYKRDRSAVGE